MGYVTIKPELIRWAQERSGLSDEDLQKHFKKFQLWQSGEAMPTLCQLESLAKKTLTPLGYFFLPEPPKDELPIFDFRTVGDEPIKQPSPNLLETIQIMQRRQQWLRNFLIEQGEQPFTFIGSVNLSDDVKQSAMKLHEILDISHDWAQHHKTWNAALDALYLAVETIGVIITINSVVGNNNNRNLDINEFRGFILSDEYAPLIFINGADTKAAQMFTLVHEVVHLLIGKRGVFNFNNFLPVSNPVEQFCNSVAAEFLVPESEMEVDWFNVKNEAQPFEVLAKKFKVSPIVAARRALDLKLINKIDFFEFYHEYQDDARRKKATAKSGGGNFYATQNFHIGRRFADTVIRAAKEGRLLYNEAYHLTGLYGKTYDQYVKKFEAWKKL
ncbi:DNA-binding protein [Candidatus Magnetobacterium bavaricum]|uniref:DNA-binding protein n=1 Tax=Candidatus Magnetobacterium bavaricum TaxID=29290 RepID=A0A0F3GKL7_9BACT|nr:DNA-binding protein [Candidatus Magnetobacterium bavaricum]